MTNETLELIFAIQRLREQIEKYKARLHELTLENEALRNQVAFIGSQDDPCQIRRF